MRKELLVSGEYYHIFSRSIAKFVIFNNDQDFERFRSLIDYYRYKDLPVKYSKLMELTPINRKIILKNLHDSNVVIIEIVAYCIMPTHFHLILKQISDNGITDFMKKVLDSYTRNFNIIHGRKGPLWEDHFKNVLVKTDEQMLHLSRYIHLNPVTAGLVKKPNEWVYSSCLEYFDKTEDKLCNFKDIIDVPREKYKEFVSDQISYQKELGLIKHLLIDNYSG